MAMSQLPPKYTFSTKANNNHKKQQQIQHRNRPSAAGASWRGVAKWKEGRKIGACDKWKLLIDYYCVVTANMCASLPPKLLKKLEEEKQKKYLIYAPLFVVLPFKLYL